ncbi:MAG: high-affinity Fe2+/Pb2+ permease [Thermoleophilia bacterium]|nr:high-affinity Fe2+/Pb2+ permease [Thermoleophilia bacterium]
MGESFLISLREGVEISLIVAILLTYLNRVGRRDAFAAVWVGVGVAALACFALAAVFLHLIGGFTGRAEMATEAIVSIAAAGMLTFMIFWMRRHSRTLRSSLQEGLGRAAAHSFAAMALFAGIAVLREGIETALLLVGAERETGDTSLGFLAGGVAGLAVACGIGVMVYHGSRRVDLRRFFSATAFLLILFAAGMVGKAAHELREFTGAEGGWASPVWDVTTPLFSTSWFADFLGGMFGWSPAPETVRVIAYVAYLVPVLALYFGDAVLQRRARPHATAPLVPSR